MSIQLPVTGALDTETVVLGNTTTTVLLDADEFGGSVFIHSITYASATGDTLTLDTYDDTTAFRLRQVAISANSDGVYEVVEVLRRGWALRGTLTTGNATSVRVTYSIPPG